MKYDCILMRFLTGYQNKRFDLGCSYSTTKRTPTRVSFLCGWGVLKKHRVLGDSREQPCPTRHCYKSLPYAGVRHLAARPQISTLCPPQKGHLVGCPFCVRWRCCSEPRHFSVGRASFSCGKSTLYSSVNVEKRRLDACVNTTLCPPRET